MSESVTKRLVLAGDVLDILHDLWPKPADATVQLESHQWIRLRKVLLETIEHLVEPGGTPRGDAGEAIDEPTVTIPALQYGRPPVPPHRVSSGRWPEYTYEKTTYEVTDLRGDGKQEAVRRTDDVSD